MLTLQIDGMSCPKCVANITCELQKHPEVEKVEISLGKKEAIITGSISREVACEIIEDLGFDVV